MKELFPFISQVIFFLSFLLVCLFVGLVHCLLRMNIHFSFCLYFVFVFVSIHCIFFWLRVSIGLDGDADTSFSSQLLHLLRILEMDGYCPVSINIIFLMTFS